MASQKRQDEVIRLLMENRSHLFAFIYAVVRDINTAEEVLQETSVAICEHADRFSPGTNFGAWSREIARRRLLAYFSQKKRDARLLSENHILALQKAFGKVVDVSEDHHERLHALRKCLESLTPRIRHWLHLRYVSQLALADIATQARRPSESIRKSLYRSRRHLRACIERRMRREEQA